LSRCMRLNRISMSLMVLFIAVPRWMYPVVYGGPSTK